MSNQKTDLGWNGDGTKSSLIVGDDDSVIIHRTQDVAPILDHNKVQRSLGANRKAVMRKAASIPMVIWQNWMKEFKEQNSKDYFAAPRDAREKFMKSKLNDPDHKFLRTWEGRL